MERNVEIPRAASAIKRLTKEEIYERLRREIVDGELRPGQRLGEEWVARRLGASRTPVREALHKLEADGLVVLRPHRGALRRHAAVFGGHRRAFPDTAPAGEGAEVKPTRSGRSGFRDHPKARGAQPR